MFRRSRWSMVLALSPGFSFLRRLPVLVAVLVVALLSVSIPAAGQTGVAFEFSFSNPGARSLGLGGAFVALADDATAAFANPAGLVQLVEPEVSVEGRIWSYSTPFTQSGRASGQPTGRGLDTEPGIRRGRSDKDLAGPSYLSLVYPWRRGAVAIYRHQLANFKSSFETQGIFAEGSGPVGTTRLFDRRTTTDLEIVTLGVSGAYRLTERFSFGLGASYFDGELLHGQEVYLWDEDTVEGYFGETTYLPDRLIATQVIGAVDSDWGFTAGVCWRLTERWQLGGFFRQGPEFQTEGVVRILTTGFVDVIPSPIALPDVYGLGLAYRSADGRLALSFEWDRVEYSSIFESLGQSAELASAERIDDGDELHLGAELLLLESGPLLAARVGVWLDPDHQVRTGRDDPILLALLPQGDDELHYAVGFGAVFDRFQVDLGVDFSDLRDTLSLSAIYTF